MSSASNSSLISPSGNKRLQTQNGVELILMYTAFGDRVKVGAIEENVDGLAATFNSGPYEFTLEAVSQRWVEDAKHLDQAAEAKGNPASPH